MEWLVVSVTILLFLVLIAASFGPRKVSTSEVPKVEPAAPKPQASKPEKPRQDFSGVPERFVVFDLETTGLDANQHEIIEIGAIKITDLHAEVHAAFQTFVTPRNRIPARITQITGISQKMVDRDGKPLDSVLKDFKEFVGDLPLVAFNAKFDMAFLRRAGKTCGVVITNPSSCALEMARDAWPDLPSHKLSYLAKRGGLPDDDTHRALGDCKRTLIVYTGSCCQVYKKRKMSADQ
jgi:DNA polymerase-3 subunit epsilon